MRGNRQRDDAEFSQYVDARRATLVRTARLLGASDSEAEDLVQDTLVRCYTSWSRVRGAANQDGYVYRVMLNRLRRLRSRHSYQRETALLDRTAQSSVPPTPGPDHRVPTYLPVVAALGSLDDTDRAVLVLRFFVDLTAPQVATAMGLPLGTVKSRTHRALRRLTDHPQLQQLLDDHGSDHVR